MKQVTLFSWLLLLFLSTSVVAGDLSVVEGEPALLQVLRDAHHANSKAFPHGEMRVEAELGDLGFKSIERHVLGLVRWDGDEARVTGEIVHHVPKKDGSIDIVKEKFDVLYNKKRRLFYIEDQKRLQVSEVVEGKFPMLTRLRPDEWFYGTIDGEGTSWAKMLDIFVQHPTEYLRHWRVLRLDGDQVELTYDGKAEHPGSSRTVFSLKEDGNVVKVEKSDPIAGLSEDSTYLWERARGGGWYPRMVRITKTFRPTKDIANPGSDLRYQVLAFDPTVRPPRSIFADSAIRPAPGSFVEDERTGKRSRIGDKQVESIVPSLDGLVREVKSRGFAEKSK